MGIKILQGQGILILTLLLSASCGLTEEAPRARAGVLDLRQAEFQGMINLRGEWEFYWKKFIEPQVFKGPNPPQVSSMLPMPGSFSGSGDYSDHGYATLRLKILLPRKTADAPIIKLNFCNGACRIYANGELIHSSGKPGASVQETLHKYQPGIIRLFPHGRTDGQNLDLVLHIANYYHHYGGILGSLWIGPEQVAHSTREWNLTLDFFVFGAIWIMGLYNLLLFVLNRRDATPLYFFLFIVSVTPRLLCFGESWVLKISPDISVENLDRFSISFSFGFIFFSLYIRNLFPNFFPRSFIWVVYLLSLSVGSVAMISPAFFNLQIHDPSLFLMGVCLFINLLVIMRGLWNKSTEAYILLLGFLSLVAAALLDIGTFHKESSAQPFYSMGILLFVTSQNGILTRRFLLALRGLTRQLEERNQKLTELDQMKDEFLANTSHELRTPLHGIIGLAEAQLAGMEKSGTEGGARNLGLIVSSGKRLSRLVDDLLDFARLKNRDLVLFRKPVDLRSALQLCLELQRPLAQEKGLDLINEVAPGLTPARADEDRLLQILSNIIGNAVKFTQTGGVRVQAIQKGEQLEVRVLDTGPGIELTNQNDIFNSFAQEEGGGSRRHEGVGLGLSIARKLAELHYGKLVLESTSSFGSCFLLTLPVSSEEQALAQEFKPEAPINPELEGIPENVGRLIYFVDDDQVNLQVGKEMLGQVGYDVRTFSSGDLALEALERGLKPALIILDLMMPGKTGYEVCSEIRETYAADVLPVLILTARTRTQDFTSGLNCGANDFLTKPCEREYLLARVGNLIRLEEAGQELLDVEKDVRERMYQDLHDHLGGDLNDLKYMVDKMQAGETTGLGTLSEMRNSVDSSIDSLRQALRKNQEQKLLDDSYLDGLDMLIHERYNRRERSLDFEFDEELYRVLDGRTYEILKSLLYALVSEICTNDLKYGFGPAIWRLTRKGDGLALDIQSGSNYDTVKNKTGCGTGNIIARVARLGGNVQTEIEEGQIKINIYLPLQADTAIPMGK